MTDVTYASPTPARRSDLLGAVAAAAMAAVFLVGWLFDIQSFAFFLVTMAVDAGMILFFLAWWLTRRSYSLTARLLIPLAALAFAIAVGALTHRTIANPMMLVFNGVPVLFVVWWGAYMATRNSPARARVSALLVCFALVWGSFLLIRMTGFHGNLRGDFHWRWTPTAEELYLAQRPSAAPSAPTTAPSKPLEVRPGDWPAFRGPHRDATAHGLKISTDWQKNPPKVLWKQRVGPAWSSMIIVDNHLYTQEQRGDREAVVCRDASTGNEIWSHEDPVRFDEAMSGIGPRATPAFDNGRIFTQGTYGALNCLDASTGRPLWTVDIRKDTDAPVPMWAFCASPLVVQDRVIVYAGDESKKSQKTIAAYSTDDGHLLWTADAGKMSYGSPQLFQGQGIPAVLMFANEGLYCFDPQNGKTIWQLPLDQKVGLPAALQPCPVGPTSFVIGNGAAFGAQRLDLSPGGGPPTRAWVTPRMKPGFSDMVYHDGFIYGFDGTTFCCVDAKDGTRRWREGHYGAGQVLLLADQGLLIVSTEDGQAVLLKCTPEKSEELARLQVVTGKSWNHLAIAQNRLYLRSDAELACLQLPHENPQ